MIIIYSSPILITKLKKKNKEEDETAKVGTFIKTIHYFQIKSKFLVGLKLNTSRWSTYGGNLMVENSFILLKYTTMKN